VTTPRPPSGTLGSASTFNVLEEGTMRTKRSGLVLMAVIGMMAMTACTSSMSGDTKMMRNDDRMKKSDGMMDKK
jgi:hypothetical protein